jgi:DNA adenine methylase
MPPSSENINPVLRWAGSKRKLLPSLLALSPVSYDRYIEPFAGSACLFFKLAPNSSLIGDINHALIDAYSCLKENPSQLHIELKKLPVGETAYYTIRKSKDSGDRFKNAAKFIYLNRFCFNGLYRTNRDGVFNVPYGGSDGRSGSLTSLYGLEKCATLLKKAQLLSGDFERCLSLAKENDFAYIDPPYAVSSRRVFSEYHGSTFSKKDIARLRGMLFHLNEIGCKFLLSYAASPEGELLSKGFHKTKLKVQRNISGFLSGRSISDEIVVSNFSIKNAY